MSITSANCSSFNLPCQLGVLWRWGVELVEEIAETLSFKITRVETIAEPMVLIHDTDGVKNATAEAEKHPDKNVAVVIKSSNQLYLFLDKQGKKELVDMVEISLAKVDPYYAKRCSREGCTKKVELYFPTRVSLGFNDGKKIRAGDHKTPEGTYSICDQKHNGEFVASLAFNYPNYDDIARGRESGQISDLTYERLKSYLDKGLCPPQSPMGYDLLLHGSRKTDEELISLRAEDDPDMSFITHKNQTFGCPAVENHYAYYLRSVLTDGDKIVILP